MLWNIAQESRKECLDFPMSVNLGKQIENLEKKMFDWGVWSEAYCTTWDATSKDKERNPIL
jgi:hypothetical protein